MNKTEVLTRYTAHFVDELARNGVQDVIISPGSRSTPLAMTFSEHKDIKEWIVIDERSAAFFGLGMAKRKQRPVALLCTSGTAVANYFPAIVEAYHSRVPLLVLSADRPHELRDVGAPQAIDQIGIFGTYVKWFQEMALPEATESMLSYVRSKASHALYLAQEGNAGPVHLNFPFREPLIPDFTLDHLWGQRNEQAYHDVADGKKRLDEVEVSALLHKLTGKQKGVIVCGPQLEKPFAKAVVDLATKWGLPILADPLSQVRSGTHSKDQVIEGYDAILRHEKIREQLKPDFIIRFGAMPVSKSYLFYVQENEAIKQFVVENSGGFRDPSSNSTEFIYADSTLLCYDLLKAVQPVPVSTEWLQTWQKMNELTKRHLSGPAEKQITEGEAVRSTLEVVPETSCLYVGNSMAVRDLDTFFMTTKKDISVLANRGVNGIDGMVSSALGAAATGRYVTLILGDLSFYHDLNGLLAARHYELNMTIVLINNDGGGIFSFLPQVDNEKHFEPLFGTPLGIDFKQVVEMYHGEYELVYTEEDFKTKLAASYLHKGLSVIEVKTDRAENLSWHHEKWAAINKDLLAYES